jgi:large subunit ribosomal protein L11
MPILDLHRAFGQVLRLRDEDTSSILLLRKAAKLDSGSKAPGRDFVGAVTLAQVRTIAQAKMKDLNANDVDAAMLMIIGSARSMGIEVKG